MLRSWGCPFKIRHENRQASNIALVIDWAYFRPLLDFAGQYL